MNIYIFVMFQLYSTHSFWGVAFLIFFGKFSLSIAMTSNQIQRLDKNDIIWKMRA